MCTGHLGARTLKPSTLKLHLRPVVHTAHPSICCVITAGQHSLTLEMASWRAHPISPAVAPSQQGLQGLTLKMSFVATSNTLTKSGF